MFTIKYRLVIAIAAVVVFVGYFLSYPSVDAQENISEKKKEGTVSLRFGHNTPVDSALHLAAMKFAKEVSRKSGGRLKVKVFPAQELGNDHQMVEMARRGALDIILTPTAKMSVAVPAMQYADLPFYFPTRKDVYDMLDGEPGKMLLEKLRPIGLIGVTFWENGFKQFTGNQPFLTPEDFKGKKIRVMKSRMIMDQFKSLGANPIPIDFHSTRKALADNVVDGQENPLIAIVSMGFHEVQSDLVLSEHAYLGYVFSLSQKTLKKLSLAERNILIETAKEITPWEREETQRRETKLIETIKASGVKVHHLDSKQRRAFSAITAHIVEEFEAVIGPDIISKTEELLLKKYGPAPESKEQIVIGMDADFSISGIKTSLAIKRGAELAITKINSQGGLLGKPVVLLAKDNHLTPNIGRDNVAYFANRDDVVAILGGKHSAVINEEIPLIQKRKIPYLVSYAAAEKLTRNGYEDNYLFRVSVNDSFSTKYLAEHMKVHGIKPIIIVENTVWGRSALEQIRSYLGRSQQAIASLIINRGQKEFKRELMEIQSLGADTIILVTDTIEGSRLIKMLEQKSITMPIISHWGIAGGDFYDNNKNFIKKSHLEFIQTFSFITTNSPLAKSIAKEYTTRYHIEDEASIEAPVAVAQSYELVMMLAQAIRKARTTERTAVKKALEHLGRYEGVIKRYDPPFTPSDHDALDITDLFMATYDKQGHIVPMYGTINKVQP